MGKIKIGRRIIETSNEDKTFFPDADFTKGDIVEYYRRVAEYMLPHLKDRPLTMHRYPDGITEDGFFQKKISDYFPDWIDRKKIKKEKGTYTQVICNKQATLVYLADQACLTPHIWLSRIDKIRYPDRLVFDLDPPGGDFDKVRQTALKLCRILQEIELSAYIMLTGSTGLHMVIPLRRELEFDRVREVARKIASRAVEKYPDLMTLEQRKNKRRGRVFLDTLRNAYGQTVVAPYSVRARKGAPVATPIDPDDLSRSSLDSQKYSIKTVFRRLKNQGDTWHDINRHAVSPKGIERRLENL